MANTPKEALRSAGPQAPGDSSAVTERCVLPAEGMDCPSCASTASRGLLGLEGVRSVEPDIIAQTVTVDFEPDSVGTDRLRASLDSLGYGAPDPAPGPMGTEIGLDGSTGPGAPGARRFLRELPPHVMLGGALWALTILATLLGDSEAMVGILALATVATTGWKIFPRAFQAGRRGIFDMHVLMGVAALGALLIGEFVEAGAVLFLFAIARELEQRTLDRARSEVRSLMDLTPVEATVLRHGHRVQVPVDAVRRGEIVLVRPGERIPVDGTVVSGASEVDASAITGESIPESRFEGDHVFGGSVNGSGALEVQCDQPAAESALGRILKSIEQARSEKSRTETFIDRFARIYTPAVMAGAVLLATAPPLLGLGGWAEWGYRALVLVVIACPCALVISTPVTVVSALTGAARRGILVKSGLHLELLGRVKVVALDKTGTLTEGRPRVSRVVTVGDTAPDELTRLVAAAESRSEHPIARAILEYAGASRVPMTERVEMTALPGLGARARVEDRSVLLGSPRLFRDEGILTTSLASELGDVEEGGGSLVLVAWSDPGSTEVRLRGALELTDHLRPWMTSLLPALRSNGIDRIVCMSGDRSRAVEAAVRAIEEAKADPRPDGGDGPKTPGRAGGARFDDWRGDLLPEEKVAWVRELRREHGPVLMVGDGVNDAPALAAADVGMAMARSGTAVALDTADVALMEDELDRIPDAFRLGRKSAGIIRTNIAFALAVKVVFVALGAAGIATLWMAVLADMGSSLAVILNGLRALRT